VPLGKIWAYDGGELTEITAILSFQIEPPPDRAKQAAIAAAFA
jgi:hypothetical protein